MCSKNKDSLLAIVFPAGARLHYKKEETQKALDEFADLYAIYTRFTRRCVPDRGNDYYGWIERDLRDVSPKVKGEPRERKQTRIRLEETREQFKSEWATLKPVLDSICKNSYVKGRVGYDKTEEWIMNLFLSHL